MGVKYIQYKIAKCDICGREERFDAVYSLPRDWCEITSLHGSFNYECVCHECNRQIQDYIEELKMIRYKVDMEDKR